MFAVIQAGQLVQTDGIRVDDRRMVFNLDNLDKVNHIIVFMTGQIPFPDGFGGSVYLSWSGDVENWQLIGHITNEKPSAVFKISGLKNQKSCLGVTHAFSNMASANQAQVGISIEPLGEILNQISSLDSAEKVGNTFNQFVTSMCSGLFNYISSFSVTPEQIVEKVQQSTNISSASQAQYVPLSVLEDWFKKFQSKLSRDIYFWKK